MRQERSHIAYYVLLVPPAHKVIGGHCCKYTLFDSAKHVGSSLAEGKP
jgi:hypothetical protein